MINSFKQGNINELCDKAKSSTKSGSIDDLKSYIEDAAGKGKHIAEKATEEATEERRPSEGSRTFAQGV